MDRWSPGEQVSPGAASVQHQPMVTLY